MLGHRRRILRRSRYGQSMTTVATLKDHLHQVVDVCTRKRFCSVHAVYTDSDGIAAP